MMENPDVSIIIPTIGRNTLYPLIEKLLDQKVKFDYEIILIPQVELDKDKLNDKRIKIYPEELGKGYAYYRNAGIQKSKGDIIVFIDDDELPQDNNWLEIITAPLLKENQNVVTAGVEIKLGQGHLTDSLSLLGFPGGGGWF